MAEIKLRGEPNELDFLSLGAVVHRLDPGTIPFRKASSARIHVSGGEYNVAAGLANCFGLRAGIATAMPRYGIGELVQDRIRCMGVTPIYKWFDHDGVRGPNIATVYSDLGHGVRPPVVFYNRANEAGALLKPGDFDWEGLFARGVRWFHSGGIFSALSETTAELIIEAMQTGRKHKVVNSFDLNYRAKLWAPIGGLKKAQKILRRIVEHVDVLIGNEEDLQLGLGIAGPKAGSTSKLDPQPFFDMIGRVTEQFPNIRLVATTLREVRSANRHQWGAVLWYDGHKHVTPTCELHVLDRIGGGDGFAAGLIYGFIAGKEAEQALRLGWAHGALLTTFPGDTTMATLAEVEAFASGGSARVQR